MLTVIMLGVPTCWKGVHVLKQAQACCFLQISFCWVFYFYTLCWAYTFSSHWSSGSGSVVLSLDYFREGHWCLPNWFSRLSTAKTLSSLLGVGLSSASSTIAVATSYVPFWASWAHHPCLFFSEPSSIVGIHWSVTGFCFSSPSSKFELYFLNNPENFFVSLWNERSNAACFA